MSNDNPNINDFDFNLICEYFSSTDRQGPGNEESTLKALSLLPTLPSKAQIADLGCGTGSSALILAKHTEAQVTALDLFPQFLDKLKARAKANGVSEKIATLVGSMDALPFADETFDVIWSEGAIYNIGFQRGIKEWKRFIKKSGYIAVSESSWLTDERPKEIEDFWAEAYSEMDTVANKVKQMQEAGYQEIKTFLLPEECWTKNFYLPQRKAQACFLQRHPDNPTAQSLVSFQRHEAELYEKYKDYYGYVFYIGRK